MNIKELNDKCGRIIEFQMDMFDKVQGKGENILVVSILATCYVCMIILTIMFLFELFG